MDRILKHFVKPLSESREPKISFISEDDLEFLRAVGDYMYEKRVDKKEALNNLNPSLKTGRRRSELCFEVQRASQDRLANHSSIFSEVDVSNFNEEDIGGLVASNCSWMGNIISGTTDGNLLEGARAVGEYPLEVERVILHTPVLERWLKGYISESKHSIAITEFLNSVQDALLMDKTQEVIAEHDTSIQGKITYAK